MSVKQYLNRISNTSKLNNNKINDKTTNKSIKYKNYEPSMNFIYTNMFQSDNSFHVV